MQCTEGGGTCGRGGELVCAVLPHTQVAPSSLLPPLLLWYLWCVTPVSYHAWCDVMCPGATSGSDKEGAGGRARSKSAGPRASDDVAAPPVRNDTGVHWCGVHWGQCWWVCSAWHTCAIGAALCCPVLSCAVLCCPMLCFTVSCALHVCMCCRCWPRWVAPPPNLW